VPIVKWSSLFYDPWTCPNGAFSSSIFCLDDLACAYFNLPKRHTFHLKEAGNSPRSAGLDRKSERIAFARRLMSVTHLVEPTTPFSQARLFPEQIQESLAFPLLQMARCATHAI
jgi:hypothetical protein